MRLCGACGQKGSHADDCVIGSINRKAPLALARKGGTDLRPRLRGGLPPAPAPFAAEERAAPPVAQQKELLEYWAKHPWNWLSGTDFDGTPLIRTADEKDEERPIKPYPTDKPYLKRLVQILVDERLVMVDKSRQMIVSTTCLLVIDWYCRFRDARRWLVSKHKEGESVELIKDKIRRVHERLPKWVQEALPQSKTPAIRVDYPGTGSYIRAVAQNVAQSEARGGTASGMLIDEAARQDQFGDIMAASLPMAGKIWAVTTAMVGSQGARTFKSYIDEGKA